MGNRHFVSNAGQHPVVISVAPHSEKLRGGTAEGTQRSEVGAGLRAEASASGATGAGEINVSKLKEIHRTGAEFRSEKHVFRLNPGNSKKFGTGKGDYIIIKGLNNVPRKINYDDKLYSGAGLIITGTDGEVKNAKSHGLFKTDQWKTQKLPWQPEGEWDEHVNAAKKYSWWYENVPNIPRNFKATYNETTKQVKFIWEPPEEKKWVEPREKENSIYKLPETNSENTSFNSVCVQKYILQQKCKDEGWVEIAEIVANEIAEIVANEKWTKPEKGKRCKLNAPWNVSEGTSKHTAAKSILDRL